MKEAIALAQSGYSVTILTAVYSNQLLLEDYALIKDTSILYEVYSDLRATDIRSFTDRLIKKLATHLYTILRLSTIASIGYGAGRLLRKCLQHKADLYIMHQELATVTGCALLKRNYKVIFDFEDWYSEDLLAEARKQRPLKLLKKVEKFALQNAACYTTSNAMADALTDYYELNQSPAVIYNTFAPAEEIAAQDEGDNSIRLYWFSQTIGPGRGLDFFISTVAKSNYSWTITLRGNVDEAYKSFLQTLIAPKDQLEFLPLLKNELILNDMKNYDIGLALEPFLPPNKNLTISNKFFHYMAAGMPIIASDTAGHSEIGALHPNFVFLYKQNDGVTLLELLNSIGKNKNAVTSGTLKKQVLQTFNSSYAWQTEERKLLEIVKKQFKSS